MTGLVRKPFQLRPQRFDERQIRQREIFVAAAEADLHAEPRGDRPRLVKQACLADPGVALNQHDARMAPACLLQPALEPAQLLRATDEGRDLDESRLALPSPGRLPVHETPPCLPRTTVPRTERCGDTDSIPGIRAQQRRVGARCFDTGGRLSYARGMASRFPAGSPTTTTARSRCVGSWSTRHSPSRRTGGSPGSPRRSSPRSWRSGIPARGSRRTSSSPSSPCVDSSPGRGRWRCSRARALSCSRRRRPDARGPGSSPERHALREARRRRHERPAALE